MSNRRGILTVLIILATLNHSMTKAVFADIPQVRNVIVYESGGSTFLNITIYHNTETASHYVDTIKVSFEANTTSWAIGVQPLSPDLTFNITYDMGPVTGNPSATVQADCNVHGWSFVNWSGPIPELPSSTLLLLMLLLLSLSVMAIRKARPNF